MTGERYATIENLSSGIAIVWGLALLNPYVDSFDRNPTLFAPMRQIVYAEWVWGLVFLVCLYMSLKKRRIIASLILFVYFGFIALLFGLGDLTSQAFAIYGLIALFNLAHWRAWRWSTYQNG